MKYLIVLLCLMLAACNSRKYVDELKHPTIFYDEFRTSEDFKRVTANIDSNSFVALRKYKSNYYFYIPCEMMWHHQIDILKDSVNLIVGEDFKMKIDSVKYEDNTLIYFLSNEFTTSYLEMKKINNLKGVYVAKLVPGHSLLAYYLYLVKGDKLNQFPVIVNDCIFEKVNELEFEDDNLSAYFQ